MFDKIWAMVLIGLGAANLTWLANPMSIWLGYCFLSIGIVISVREAVRDLLKERTKLMPICCDLCQPKKFSKAVVRVFVTVESIETGEVRTKQRDLCAAHAGVVGCNLPTGLRGILNTHRYKQLSGSPALRLTGGG